MDTGIASLSVFPLSRCATRLGVLSSFRRHLSLPAAGGTPGVLYRPAPFPRTHGRSFAKDRAFDRVRQAYDLDRLANSRVICVGCGGSAAVIEDLARAGVGEFVLVDPDRFSSTNIGTQLAYRRDVGWRKVEVIASRLRQINPRVCVKTKTVIAQRLDIESWRRLAAKPFLFGPEPVQTLLLGMTDSFEAQAFVNRVALLLGIPSLCAQVYAEGRAAEITFTHPSATKACHRCMLAPRYEAYEGGFQNDVGSAGAPIFSTARLNALKGFISLALLHRDSSHPRWGKLLERIGDRTLVQVRMDPDVGHSLGLKVFDRVFGEADKERVLFDEAVWLPQLPEPECPDCGGKGCQPGHVFAD